MAWTEAALEELGLAPAWRRRPATEPVQSVQSVQSADHTDVPAFPADAADSRAPAERGAEAAAAATAAARDTEAGMLARRGERSQVLEAHNGADMPRPAAEARRAGSAAPSAPAAPAAPADADDDFAWPDFEPADPAEAFLRDSEAPRETPVAELDWDALEARVADCRRCGLCEKRTQTVFGVGDRAADWMLIGEAPGENEDKQGEPFVGQAGKLLDNMLRALALERGQNVYIANVIKCRPPGNRNPEPAEVARCEPYLQRQVALVKPKLIVALGRFAAQTLLKSEASIASLRSRVHQYEGVPVIVTYHPAYLLRSLPDKAKAWADLCLARATYEAVAQPAAAQPRADA